MTFEDGSWSVVASADDAVLNARWRDKSESVFSIGTRTACSRRLPEPNVMVSNGLS